LKLTSKELQRLGIADSIIAEPLGGAHRNIHDAVYNVEQYIIRTLRELKRMDTDSLLAARYNKLRTIGKAATMLEQVHADEHKIKIAVHKITADGKIKSSQPKALKV